MERVLSLVLCICLLFSVSLAFSVDASETRSVLILGDANGDGLVNTADAYTILLFADREISLGPDQIAVSDVDASGMIDVLDAYYILLYYGEEIDSLPGQGTHIHSLTASVVEPTCSEFGYTEYICLECGWSYVDEFVSPLGCVNTETRLVEPTCTADGALIIYCADCGKQLQLETLPASGNHSYSTKMNLAEAVKEAADRGNTRWYAYIQNEDFDVMVCSGCGDIDINTMTFRYNDTETTDIMLSYINPLREAAGVYPLVADPWLIGKARDGMETYLSTGRAPSFNFSCYKFCVDGGYNIRHHFTKAGGAANSDFLLAANKYFAYVVGVPRIRENGIYGIILIQNGT